LDDLIEDQLSLLTMKSTSPEEDSKPKPKVLLGSAKRVVGSLEDEDEDLELLKEVEHLSPPSEEKENKPPKVKINFCAAPPKKNTSSSNSKKNNRNYTTPEVDDELTALLAQHNKKFKQTTYEPRKYSFKEIKLWEQATGKSWMNGSMKTRDEANEWIANYKKQHGEVD